MSATLRFHASASEGEGKVSRSTCRKQVHYGSHLNETRKSNPHVARNVGRWRCADGHHQRGTPCVAGEWSWICFAKATGCAARSHGIIYCNDAYCLSASSTCLNNIAPLLPWQQIMRNDAAMRSRRWRPTSVKAEAHGMMTTTIIDEPWEISPLPRVVRQICQLFFIQKKVGTRVEGIENLGAGVIYGMVADPSMSRTKIQIRTNLKASQ